MHIPPGRGATSERVALADVLCVRPPSPTFKLQTSEVPENLHPAIFGPLAELLLDAQQAIVLGQALRARDGADFNLGSRSSHREISQGSVFRLARARADHSAVAVLLRQADHFERLG